MQPCEEEGQSEKSTFQLAMANGPETDAKLQQQY